LELNRLGRRDYFYTNRSVGFRAMTRPPKARQRILDAARHLVESRGAGHLTFDELARVSGVTRGGITYHFPTKEDLLRGLVAADLAQWESAAIPREGPDLVGLCPRSASVLGQLQCHLSEDEAHKRFVSGMLSAAMVDSSLLQPIREHQQREFADWSWDEADLRRYLVLAASEGLFWQDIFNLGPLPAEARPRFKALLEQLLLEWSGPVEKPSPQIDTPPIRE
jgi:AcrR family transcriptional regulator